MNKTKNYITWALTILMAIAFLGAGFAKASGNDAMAQSFYAFDLPDWFRITIGVLEMIGGALILVPALSGMSSFGLSIIMIGAMLSHSMYDPITAAIPAFVFFLILTYIYLTRKNVIPKAVQKYLIG